MYHSEQLGELASALALAQGELRDADKSSVNPAFKSRYADLATVLQTVRPVLSKHGLAVTQTLGAYSKESGTLQVSTILLHKSGQFLGDSLYVPVVKPDAQGLGGAATYGRRYGLAAICGIAQDDDDGETAVGRGDTAGPGRKVKAKPAAPPPTMSVPELTAAFAAAANKDELSALAGAFASLQPDDQNKVLPAVKAARARLGL